MSIAASLLPEFDQEMANTRKTLERVPDDKLPWKPHEKSGTMAWLAGHVARLPEWCRDTIKLDSFDMAPNGVQVQPPPPAKSRKELLEVFDKGVTEARAALSAATDQQMNAPWSLVGNGQTYFTMPRLACYRIWVMNHLIHHRAQLSVYLRLNNVPVPALYGPSADETGM
jgi:uncharacterized damage-inducible protein DinB